MNKVPPVGIIIRILYLPGLFFETVKDSLYYSFLFYYLAARCPIDIFKSKKYSKIKKIYMFSTMHIKLFYALITGIIDSVFHIFVICLKIIANLDQKF